MSKKQSTCFNLRRRPHIALCSRRLCTCGFWIAGAFVLLAIVLAVNQEAPPPEEVTRAVSPLLQHRVNLTTPPVFDAQSYDQTIIDNNLFRPLGDRTPPPPIEPYRLIGTIHPTDDRTPRKPFSNRLLKIYTALAASMKCEHRVSLAIAASE